MKVSNHEANAKGQVEALQHPDPSHQDHRNADQAADDAHGDIEGFPHAIFPYLSVTGGGLWRWHRSLFLRERGF